MLPIAPLDYERYAVVHSPLLVAEAGHVGSSASTRIAEPIGYSAMAHRRQDTESYERSTQTRIETSSLASIRGA